MIDSDGWFWMLVHHLWLGALVAGVAALLAQRTRCAVSRYRLLIVAFWTIVGLPAATLAPPAWWAPAPQMVAPQPSPAPALPDVAVAAPLASASPSAPASAGPLPPRASEPAAATPERWRTTLLIALAAAIAVRLGLLSLGWLSARRLIGTSTPLAPNLVGSWTGPDGQVRASDRVASPVVLGVLRPVILIPRDFPFRGLELDAILAHEMAHIRRRDPLANALEQLALALLPYHPALYWLRRLITEARENACDEQVIQRTGIAAAAYSKCLLQAYRCRQGWPVPRMAIGGSGRGSQLRRRITYLQWSARRDRGPSWLAAGLLVAVAVVCTGAALAAMPRATLAKVWTEAPSAESSPSTALPAALADVPVRHQPPMIQPDELPLTADDLDHIVTLVAGNVPPAIRPLLKIADVTSSGESVQSVDYRLTFEPHRITDTRIEHLEVRCYKWDPDLGRSSEPECLELVLNARQLDTESGAWVEVEGGIQEAVVEALLRRGRRALEAGLPTPSASAIPVRIARQAFINGGEILLQQPVVRATWRHDEVYYQFAFHPTTRLTAGFQIRSIICWRETAETNYLPVDCPAAYGRLRKPYGHAPFWGNISDEELARLTDLVRAQDGTLPADTEPARVQVHGNAEQLSVAFEMPLLPRSPTRREQHSYGCERPQGGTDWQCRHSGSMAMQQLNGTAWMRIIGYRELVDERTTLELVAEAERYLRARIGLEPSQYEHAEMVSGCLTGIDRDGQTCEPYARLSIAINRTQQDEQRYELTFEPWLAGGSGPAIARMERLVVW